MTENPQPDEGATPPPDAPEAGSPQSPDATVPLSIDPEPTTVVAAEVPASTLTLPTEALPPVSSPDFLAIPRTPLPEEPSGQEASPLLGGVGPLPVPDPVATAPAFASGATQTAPPEPRGPRGPRIGTILWGFAIIVAAIAILASALGAVVDFVLVAIGVLAIAGATLVIGSIVSSARRRGHE